MHRLIAPSTASEEGLVEQAQDPTAPRGLQFYHADEGKPLATPWQVAVLRAMALKEYPLPPGLLVDCACGSGIQLAAYASVLQRPVLGIELEALRAQASAVNLRKVAEHQRAEHESWLNDSAVLVGDGTQASNALGVIDSQTPIAFLHLDPARPRNSRTHALDEMQPPLDNVLSSWAPHLADDPSILLDLSPRLTEAQRLEVEALVDAIWPGIKRTWEWTSRGRGRVDRLALWIGNIASPEQRRRFVRVPPSLGEAPLVLHSDQSPEVLNQTIHPPKRGEFVSLLDAALLESGLVSSWLGSVSKDRSFRWAVLEGRRPQVHHDHELRLDAAHRLLVQATGRVVELLPFELNEDTVDDVVERALEHHVRSVKLRLELDPAQQPLLQGSLDRQLQRRHGQKDGFLVQHPNGQVLLLCVDQFEAI